jgi:serine protease Do
MVSEDGYILTNDHVVADADQITVWLNDGRYFPAELVGTDQFTDVAVIRVDADGEPMPHLSFGSSDEVRVGEWILAVGNPGFGGGSQLDYTVTAGIVSAVGRPLGLIQRELQQELGTTLAGYSIEDFIQTDAVINPGNSGGPMVDLRGQVVGINSAIASATGFYQGYGFAIPINLARRVMEDLIEYGTVRRAWLGVSMRTVDSEAAEVYGLPAVAGALVQGFPDGSPAADAGLEPEDVIVGIDGRSVARSGQLQQLIAMKRPGDRVTVDIWRNGRERNLDVTLGEAPLQAEPERVAERPTAAIEESLGIQVSDLTDELAERWGYEEAGGAVITSVQRGGPAARRGVGAGLRILEVNRVAVSTADDVKEALSGVEAGEVVTLLMADPSGATYVSHVRAAQ